MFTFLFIVLSFHTSSQFAVELPCTNHESYIHFEWNNEIFALLLSSHLSLFYSMCMHLCVCVSMFSVVELLLLFFSSLFVRILFECFPIVAGKTTTPISKHDFSPNAISSSHVEKWKKQQQQQGKNGSRETDKKTVYREQ